MAYDLKKEEEVKEYLQNLYTEYKFGCCNEKKPEVCHLLGDYEESINNDFKKAAEIYKNTCDEFGYGRSCAKFAGYIYYGKGCAQNTEVSYDYFKKSCEKGDGKGCANFGFLSTNQDVNKDRADKEKRFADGLEALKKSCYDYNVERGCFLLGALFIKGVKGYLDANFSEAYKAMLQACEYGNPQACANISIMHKKGDGVEKNEQLAQVFKERALDLTNQMKNDSSSISFQKGIS